MTSIEPPSIEPHGHVLQRPRRGNGRLIAGVCAALAARFGVSVTLVRIGFVIFGLVGAGELAYLVLWIVIPKEP